MQNAWMLQCSLWRRASPQLSRTYTVFLKQVWRGHAAALGSPSIFVCLSVTPHSGLDVLLAWVVTAVFAVFDRSFPPLSVVSPSKQVRADGQTLTRQDRFACRMAVHLS